MTEPVPRPELRKELERWGPLVIASLVLLWHSLQYDFVTDDAYISFVFSRNFADHGQLVFNPGERVEGYTNFLWTLILGVLMFFGVPPEYASRVLGTALGLGTLWMSFRITERLLGRGHVLAGLPPLLLAWSSGFACWTSGGLETQLYTFLIAAALDAYAASDATPRAFRRVGWLMALASMTRPEGPLVVALFAAHRLATNVARDRRLRPTRDELFAAAWFVGLWAPWFAWRWWYYGHPFPNTYYVKATDPPLPDCWAQGHDRCAGIRKALRAASSRYDAKMRTHGLHYISRWFEQTALRWASPLVVLGLIARPRSLRFAFAWLAVIVIGVYLYYVDGVGGDFMGLHRFIMPLFVLAAILVTLGVDFAVGLARQPAPIARVASAAAAAVLVAVFAVHQLGVTTRSLRFVPGFPNDQGIDTPAFLRVYAHDRALIGRRLRPCVRPDDYAIFGGVGALPYYAHLRGIDVFGLVSSRIAHEVPRTFDRPGHNKWGPEDLLEQYHPTIVMHRYTIRREPGVAPVASAEYWEARGFERVVLHVPGMLEKGEYITFLARKDRQLACPGLER